MSFSYRYDNDDTGNYDRYKYSYVAQFGCDETKTKTKTCAARIHLPRKAGGNLRDGGGVTYFVYAEYRVVDERTMRPMRTMRTMRTIFIDKLEAINFDDKMHMTAATDSVIEFFANEVLMDRHAFDVYAKPESDVAADAADAAADVAAAVDVVDAWEDVGPPPPPTTCIKINPKKLVGDAGRGKTLDYTETDEKKLTLAWFAPDPDSDLYFL